MRERRCSGGKHRGSWDVVTEQYTPGLFAKNGDIEIKEARGEHGMRLLLGVTNIAQRCSNCGWVQVISVTGKVGHINEHVQDR